MRHCVAFVAVPGADGHEGSEECGADGDGGNWGECFAGFEEDWGEGGCADFASGNPFRC